MCGSVCVLLTVTGVWVCVCPAACDWCVGLCVRHRIPNCPAHLGITSKPLVQLTGQLQNDSANACLTPHKFPNYWQCVEHTPAGLATQPTELGTNTVFVYCMCSQS